MYLFCGSKASFGTTLWQWNCYFLVSTRRENVQFHYNKEVYVSLESERGFISSQILLIGDRNEICVQIFSGFRTEHTCSVHLVDYEWGGRVVGSWRFPSGRFLFQISFMFLLVWMFFRMKVVTICLTKCCKITSIVWWQIIWSDFTGNSGRSRKQGQGVMQWMQLVCFQQGGRSSPRVILSRMIEDHFGR